MRLMLAVLLLVAGCAGDQGGEDGSARVRMNGVYTAFGAGALHR